MNLHETVRALEAKNIIVALDIGVHQYCALDSNCPLAVQLRKLIADAGITLEELLEGYQAVTAPDPVDNTLPQVDSILHIKVMGKAISLDMEDVVSGRIQTAVRGKLRELDSCRSDLGTVGRMLYQSYLAEIRKQRDSTTLPQLTYSISALLDANCLITSREGRYNFLFPVRYRPRYIVRRHVRYQLLNRDVRDLERDIYIKFIIGQNDAVLRADTITQNGRKFHHYHGNDVYDCWGDVSLPHRWDKTLTSLARLAYTLILSLGTINRDSILLNTPRDMPHVNDLMDRSTELGEEGEVSEHPIEQPTERRRWGGTARGGQRQTAATGIRTLEEERMGRWGMPEPPRDMNLVCNLCGERAGEHFRDGTLCPRDHWRHRDAR